MAEDERLPNSIGIDAPRLLSRVGCRAVLAVVHTVASCHRVLDVVESLERDPRVQVVFTLAPDVFDPRVDQRLRDLGAPVLPWSQVIRYRFDLAIAAAYGGLSLLHAPVMVFAHGPGRGEWVPPAAGARGPVLIEPTIFGLDAQRLIKDGRVIAAALLLSHESERGVLRRQCPEALDVAEVVGDPCLDRLVASLPRRKDYRYAFGVSDEQQLVVVSSTWEHEGLLGETPDLLPRLLNQLPPQVYRVGALLHPDVWVAPGSRQIRAWLRQCRLAGLVLLDPRDDWRTLLIAADKVIGDHGPATVYAAAIGRPVLRLASAKPPTRPGYAQYPALAKAVPVDLNRPLAPQLLDARPIDPATVMRAITSRLGQADSLIRNTMYRILRLPVPGVQPALLLSVPRRLNSGGGV